MQPNAPELPIAAGRSPALVFRPRATAAFGRLDRLRPGYAAAQEAARDHGFEPLLRPVGGHAVVYDERSVVFDEVTPHDDIAAGIQDRFAPAPTGSSPRCARSASIPRSASCPASTAPAPTASASTASSRRHGQRVVSGAALFSAVVLVGGGDAIRAALTDIYTALDLDWDPSTAGAIQDVAPHITPEAVEAALRAVVLPRG